MSESLSISLRGVSKMYKVFPRRLDQALDAFRLAWLMPWRRAKPREFWALRDIDLELPKGRRLGIIGRNGAGKSTLLKLISGHISHTEGQVSVEGQVQALLETGAGFHPEFTGYENIRSALTYQGLNEEAIEEAIQDISEFTELGEFLGQPFKTYSSGMQARLTFATATVLRPEILIIDEILGAGDAYFFNKSQERMSRLVEKSGASILIVSHALEQIIRFCEEAIWIERGRIVKRGPSIEVVDSYQRFILMLDDRRLKAKNQKARLARFSPAQNDLYGDSLLLTFIFSGGKDAGCDLAAIKLFKDDKIEDILQVGDAQDSNVTHTAFVELQGSSWSAALRTEEGYCRRLEVQPGADKEVVAYAFFHSYCRFEGDYEIVIRYRSTGLSTLSLTVSRNGVVIRDKVSIPATEESAWSEWKLPLAGLHFDEQIGQDQKRAEGDITSTTLAIRSGKEEKEVIRWPSEGSLIMEKVMITGKDGGEQAVFSVGELLTLRIAFRAQRSGHFNLLPTATLYRRDGVFISNFVGPVFPMDLDFAERRDVQLRLNPLNLGNGYFVFSAALFEKTVTKESRYDLIARGYEFQVVGNGPLFSESVFQHPGEWIQGRVNPFEEPT